MRCFLQNFEAKTNKKRNTRKGGGKNFKKKLKIFKKSLKKSVDDPRLKVLYYRCNQLRWFETNNFSDCKSTLTTTYL